MHFNTIIITGEVYREDKVLDFKDTTKTFVPNLSPGRLQYANGSEDDHQSSKVHYIDDLQYLVSNSSACSILNNIICQTLIIVEYHCISNKQ